LSISTEFAFAEGEQWDDEASLQRKEADRATVCIHPHAMGPLFRLPIKPFDIRRASPEFTLRHSMIQRSVWLRILFGEFCHGFTPFFK
jgi:hypothetical protein